MVYQTFLGSELFKTGLKSGVTPQKNCQKLAFQNPVPVKNYFSVPIHILLCVCVCVRVCCSRARDHDEIKHEELVLEELPAVGHQQHEQLPEET